MKRLLPFWIALALTISCGKNEGVRSIPPAPPPPSNPPKQAPPPSQNPGGYNPGGYGPGFPGGYHPGGQGGMYPPGGYPSGPVFQPHMPPGMPPQYYPFLPIDHYMRREPQRIPYWNQVWAGWQNYSQYVGRDEFDFNTFWYEYCPQIWSGTSMAEVYNTIDINFYEWVDPYSTSFSAYADPSYFWFYYDGMGY